jgi:hypothetical protein
MDKATFISEKNRILNILPEEFRDYAVIKSLGQGNNEDYADPDLYDNYLKCLTSQVRDLNIPLQKYTANLKEDNKIDKQQIKMAQNYLDSNISEKMSLADIKNILIACIEQKDIEYFDDTQKAWKLFNKEDYSFNDVLLFISYGIVYRIASAEWK